MKTTKTNTQARIVTLLQQAIALHNQQRLDEADEIYKKVLLQMPRHADALHLRALVFHAKGRFADAARFAEAAISVVPGVANFQNTAGEAWRRQGRPDLAQKYLRESLRLDSGMAMAHHNLSLVLHALGQDEEAQACAARALQINPAYVEAIAHALAMCCGRGDHAGAAQLAAQLQSHHGNRLATEASGRYHNYLARDHLKHQRRADAAAELDKAASLYPDFWGNWAVRAELSNEALDFANAELYCAIAANLAPDNDDARLNVGHLLLEQKRLEEAESHYAGWLAEHPDSDAARFGLASVHLLRGDFQDGWRYYESRWGLRRHGGGRRNTSAPQWTGGPCKRLLLHAEQGLGDSIQMLRFLPEVVRRCGGAVTLQVPAPLLRLAHRAAGAQGVEIVADLPDNAAFDHVCPLMSLPYVLQAHSAQQLGMPAPYLGADGQKRMFFETLLSRLPGKKIGIVWQGSQAGLTNRRRPLPLDALAPLLDVPGCSLVSLQHGVKNPVIASRPVKDLADHIHDFDDLAAAMMALDVVISVDTGPAHLAGALGIPTCTIVPWLHDWRWGLDSAQSYWYPGMTLVRQTTPGDWTAPVAQLAALLRGEDMPQHSVASELVSRDEQAHIRKNLFPVVHADCRQGTLASPLLDPAVTRALLLYGEYAPHDTDMLAPYLRAGDIAIDAGADIGAAAIGIARLVGEQGKVIAFEPHAPRYHCLLETVQANRLSWIETRPQALARRPGKITVAKADAGDRETVAAVALDSLQLPACAFIRIHAQDRELEVLDGARTLIDVARPVLQFAGVQPDAVAPLLKFLKQRGYRVFRQERPLYTAANYRNCTLNVFADAVSVTLLALPQAGFPAPLHAIEV